LDKQAQGMAAGGERKGRAVSFPLFRRSALTTKAQALLEKERLQAQEANLFRSEAEKIQLDDEERFRLRIERKRQAFLERERAKESAASIPNVLFPAEGGCFDEGSTARGSLSETGELTGATSTPLLPVFHDFSQAHGGGQHRRSMPSIPEISPSTSSSSLLPPCVVCRAKDRTHISMPCMHYSFCGDCAEKIQKRTSAVCPVCQQRDVTFGVVSL